MERMFPAHRLVLLVILLVGGLLAGGGSPPSPAVAAPNLAPQPTALTAFHRSGQTFLTWQEVAGVTGESYHLYRSPTPITAATLGAARPLTAQWGALPEGSSIFWSERAHPSGPQLLNYVIHDLGTPLTDTTGLFVWTAKETGAFYYAVTTVSNGVENRAEFSPANSLSQPVAETPADPAPVRVAQSADGLTAIYSQFMDYETYNPTVNLVTPDRPGHAAAAAQPQYAFNYSILLPQPTACGGAPPTLPLVLILHGYGGRYINTLTATNGLCAAVVYGDDPARTWYFGHSAGYDYRQGSPATTGPIVNYTEARLIRIVQDAGRGYGLPGRTLDPQRVYVQGGSMGGSGALALGLRYPNVFAAVLADVPMTNHQAAGTENPPGCCPWYLDTLPLWGSADAHLPIHLIGAAATPLLAYNGTPIWTWQNQQQMVVTRRAADTALINIGHGTLDTVIHWQSQGQPFYQPLYQSRRTFSGATRAVGHTGTGTAGVGPMSSFAVAPYDNWGVRRDETVPAFSDASGSSQVPPPSDQESNYNLNLEWGASWHLFAGAQPPLDTPTAWAIDLRTTDGSNQVVAVTPRRRQQFSVTPGATYGWENRRLSDNTLLQSGQVVADVDQLVTVAGVQVDGVGTHLRIVFLTPAPTATVTPTATATATATPTATVTVTATATVSPCTVTFSDVAPSNVFYPFVTHLACVGVLSGYSDGTYRPAGYVTRAQVAKIAALLWPEPAGIPAAQLFADVSPASSFYPYIEALAGRGIISGYNCGALDEPCDTAQRPYFRPSVLMTRGQISKIMALSGGLSAPPSGRQFADVPPTNSFYPYIASLAGLEILSGYNCGGPSEPCSAGAFYFRPGDATTRGQIAKIAALTAALGSPHP